MNEQTKKAINIVSMIISLILILVSGNAIGVYFFPEMSTYVRVVFIFGLVSLFDYIFTILLKIIELVFKIKVTNYIKRFLKKHQ